MFLSERFMPYAGKDKKRVNKQAAQTQESSNASLGISVEELKTALAKLRDEHLPVDSEEKEHFFMSQVSLGEQLCAQGENSTNSPCILFLTSLCRPHILSPCCNVVLQSSPGLSLTS